MMNILKNQCDVLSKTYAFLEKHTVIKRRIKNEEDSVIDICWNCYGFSF